MTAKGSVGSLVTGKESIGYSEAAEVIDPVDSAAKRFCIMNMNRAVPTVLPIPSGSVTSPDRAHFLRLYCGITLNNPGGGNTEIAQAKSTSRFIFSRIFSRVN